MSDSIARSSHMEAKEMGHLQTQNRIEKQKTKISLCRACNNICSICAGVNIFEITGIVNRACSADRIDTRAQLVYHNFGR